MAFSENQIQQVWEKAAIEANNDPNVFRKDSCNAWIARNQYENRDSVYGWEVDHINPVSTKGGNDNLYNLQPLHW